MDVATKLSLSQYSDRVCLFKEGIFLRAYNESCYILTELLGHSLKLSGNSIKKLKGQPILSCGFPAASVHTRLGEVVKTEWGYQLSGEWSLLEYEGWFKHHFAQLNQQKSLSIATPSPVPQGLAASEASPSARHDGHFFSLSGQQYRFLSGWQKGYYPLQVEQAFIESLKQQLNANKC